MNVLLASTALALGLATSPLAAQPIAENSAHAADADLICAAWTAFVVGNAKTEKEQMGISALVTYFAGRWEGATGRPIEDGLTVDFVSANISKIQGAKDDCLLRAGEFGRRLELVGDRLKKAGDKK